MAVGHSLHSECPKRRTMSLCAKIGKLQVLILVDSGSVGSFISQQLANQLAVPTSDCEPTRYMAADGRPMICDKRIEQLSWSYQGHTFVSNVGILPLKCFDMILGEDRLEASSPMWYIGQENDEVYSSGQKIYAEGSQTRDGSVPTCV